jgi:hypothetical protein
MAEDKLIDSVAARSLSEAASDVEAELERFEELARAVHKIELNSEKSLARAGRALTDAIACHERIVAGLRALGAAVGGAQERQQRAAGSIEAGAQHVQKRITEFGELAQGLASLGEEARSITLQLQDVASTDTEASDAKATLERSERLEKVASRMDDAVEKARGLHRRALDGNMTDIARQADALHQQLDSARRRLRATLGGLN